MADPARAFDPAELVGSVHHRRCVDRGDWVGLPAGVDDACGSLLLNTVNAPQSLECRVVRDPTGASGSLAQPPDWASTPGFSSMDGGFTLGSVLMAGSGLFVLATLFFGTKGGYYDTDDYDGNGTAH